MKLNIINQSSNIELTSYQIAFIESVLHLARVLDNLPRHHPLTDEYIHRLLPEKFRLNIPIYLVNENDLEEIKKYDNYEKYETGYNNIVEEETKEDFDDRNIITYEEMTDEQLDRIKRMRKYHSEDRKNEIGDWRPNIYKGKMRATKDTETLGYFVKNYGSLSINGFEQPAIFLCMENISKSANDHNEFLYLTTLVLLHEIAHYIMVDKNGNYYPRDKFYFWMEESLANWFVLKLTYSIFSPYHNDDYFYHEYGREYLRFQGKHAINQFVELFDFCKEFIINQPKNYQLGYYIFKSFQIGTNTTWQWSIKKHKLKNYRNKEKQEWLQYVEYEIQKDNGLQLKYLYGKIYDGLHKLSLEDIEKEIEEERKQNIINNGWADEL